MISGKSRWKWDITFGKTAKLIAENHSTCARIKVGCVITQQKRIISIGYNGVAEHQEHCYDYFHNVYLKSDLPTTKFKSYEEFIESDFFKEIHRDWSINNEIHAEQNALMFAARHGISTEGATLYSTISPCRYCAKSIVAAKIKTVIYLELYDREDTTEYLINNGIEVYHLLLEE